MSERRPHSLQHDLLLILLLMWCAILPGCRDNNTLQRYDLTGTVTFDGKPVPHGQVLFAPDSSKGNTGPGTLAIVNDGKYVTGPGQGVLGGPYVIEVVGYEPGHGADDDGEQMMNLLFSHYSIEVELPATGGTHDITIPADAALHMTNGRP